MDARPAPSIGHTLTYHYHHSGIGSRTIEVYATPDELRDLQEQGFLIRERLFDAEQVARMRAALDEVAEQERQNGNAGSVSSRFGGLFIRHLYDKHPVFLDLLNYPPLVSVARAMLGAMVQARLSARITVPGEPNQVTEWHSHQALVIPDPAPPLAAFPHSLDVLVYLDDLTEANGPVSIVPGSHKLTEEIPADDHADKPDELRLLLKAGDGIFIHNNLWHRGLPSRPDGTIRRLLAFSYFPAWIKNVNDGRPPADGLSQTMQHTTDRELRELLGLETYR